jgi:hypothetical protein
MTYNLIGLVRQVQADLNSTDPGVVATEVAKRTRPSDLRAAYQQCLRDYVRHILVRPLLPGQAAAVTQSMPAGEQGAGPSRAARYREAWRAELTAALYGASGWTTWGRASVEDLTAAAASRRDKAKLTEAEAGRLERLAQLCTEHGVLCAEQLPPDVLEAFFS